MSMKKLPPALISMICLVLAACSSDGGGSSDLTLKGTAAVGAAIEGASVTALCADGSGFTQAVTTDAKGGWTGTLVESASLPCALRVEGGTPSVVLHSYATAAGTVNVTPLTDLIIALATSQVPQIWFDGDSWQIESSALQQSQEALIDALVEAGYTVPNGNPYTTAFAIGDAWDRVLDQLAEAIENDGAIEDYEALLLLVTDGSLANLPAAPNGDDPEGPSNLAVLTAFAGTYSVSGTATEPAGRGVATRDHARNTIVIQENGDVDFDTGIAFTASDIWAIYDRTSIEGASRRVHVNYDEDDSGRKLQLYLDAGLNVLEITYSDGQGELTRAAIGGVEENEGGGGGDAKANLNGSDGITGTINGVTYAFTADKWRQDNIQRIQIAFADEGTRSWHLWLPSDVTAGSTHTCNGSTTFVQHSEDDLVEPWGQATPVLQGSCTIHVASVGAVLEGSFEAVLVNGSTSFTVTEGYFVYTGED